jgi:hypothetical protein
MKPEIIKLKVKMGSIEVEMNLEEAKALYQILDGVFGPQKVQWTPYYDPHYYPRTYGPLPAYWGVVTTGDTMCCTHQGESE